VNHKNGFWICRYCSYDIEKVWWGSSEVDSVWNSRGVWFIWNFSLENTTVWWNFLCFWAKFLFSVLHMSGSRNMRNEHSYPILSLSSLLCLLPHLPNSFPQCPKQVSLHPFTSPPLEVGPLNPFIWKRCELWNRIWCILAIKSDIWWQILLTRFCAVYNNKICLSPGLSWMTMIPKWENIIARTKCF